MKKLSKWIWDNTGKTLVIVFLLDMLFFYLLTIFYGCAPRPPRRFENGDFTFIGPKPWGEVIEDGMAKPEPEPD